MVVTLGLALVGCKTTDNFFVSNGTLYRVNYLEENVNQLVTPDRVYVLNSDGEWEYRETTPSIRADLREARRLTEDEAKRELQLRCPSRPCRNATPVIPAVQTDVIDTDSDAGGGNR